MRRNSMLFSRDRLALLFAELIGTFALTLTVLSVSKSAIGIPYFVAIGAGITLAILILVFGRTPGLHVNPAVTLGMWAVRKIGTLQALLFIAVQFMGAAFAWRLYTYLIDNTVENIAAGNFDWRILVAELVGTALFVMGIAAAVYKNYEGGKLAATVGGSLIVGIVAASAVSNGILNPAVALGVQSWSKAYVLGPLAGGLIGANLYALLYAGDRVVVSRPKRPAFLSARPQKTAPVATKSATKSTATTKAKTAKKASSRKKRK